MKYEALERDHKALKKTSESTDLNKRHDKLKKMYNIEVLKRKALKETVTLRESELKEFKVKLSKQSRNNNQNEERSDDEDVQVIKDLYEKVPAFNKEKNGNETVEATSE